jgi:hypothetical protein
MRIGNQKHHRPLATTLLFASLAIAPFLSLKAIGINPNLNAGVEAWRHVTALLGDAQEPVAASEVLALNTGQDDPAPFDGEAELLAMAQPEPQVADRAQTAVRRHCPERNRVPGRKPAVLPAIASVEMPNDVPVRLASFIPNWSALGISGSRIPAPARAGCETAARRYQQELEKHRSEIEDALKHMPRSVKLLLHHAQGNNFGLEFRTVFSLERTRQLRVAEVRLPNIENIITVPESSLNSEL